MVCPLITISVSVGTSVVASTMTKLEELGDKTCAEDTGVILMEEDTLSK
jgi:hypothetical protein